MLTAPSSWTCPAGWTLEGSTCSQIQTQVQKTPFAFLQRVRIAFDPRQTAYFIELRSGPEGHFSYRQVALDMLAHVRKVSPLFAQFIRGMEGNSFLGRLESEMTADERRQRRMHAAGDS